MNHEILRYLREQRGITREQLAEYLGDCTASTVNKWERNINPVPAWVQDKMLRSIPVTLPVEEMLALLTEAQATGQSAESILAEACRLWLKNVTPHPQENPSENSPDLVKSRAWTPTRKTVPTVVSTMPSPITAPPPASANIVPLPPQHVVALNETPQSPPVLETRDESLSQYPRPRRPKRQA